MNNLKTVHPVSVTRQHEAMIPNLLSRLDDDTPILSLNKWGRTFRPRTLTVCDILEVIKLNAAYTKIPYDNGSYGAVICIDVLDKLPQPQLMVDEIYRVTTEDPLIYVEVPFLQPYDHTSNSYYRYTPRGLEYIMRPFEMIDFGIFNGPGSTMHWVSRIFHSLLFDREGDLKSLHELAGSPNYLEATQIFGMDLSYLKGADDFLTQKEHAVCISCSFYGIFNKGSTMLTDSTDTSNDTSTAEDTNNVGGKEGSEELDAKYELRPAPEPTEIPGQPGTEGR